MARSTQVILTNMCYISDGQGNVLVQKRVKKDWPGLTFPGGHVEPGESFSDAFIREVKEETDLTILNPEFCGIKHLMWDEKTRYIALCYRADKFEGELDASEEGELFWLPRQELLNHQLSDTIEDMLPLFEDNNFTELYYENYYGDRKKFYS